MAPKCVVFDNGSGTIKAGFCGNQTPKVISPSIIGHSKDQKKETYIGSEAQSRRGLLSIQYPIEQGNITNYDDLEKLWQHIFVNELQVDSKEHRIFASTASFTQKSQHERVTETLFEKFKIPAYFTAWSAVMALAALNRDTGVVWDSGFGTSHVVPVHDGTPLHNIAGRFDVAGDDISDYMKQILNQREGSAFSNLSQVDQKEAANAIKEKIGYVAQDYEYDIQIAARPEKSLDKNYELPDGKHITVGRERFMAPEANFQATLVGLSQPALSVEIFNSVMKAKASLRPKLFGNIVLAGGNTLFPGFQRRLQKELTGNSSLAGIQVKIEAPDNRLYSVWAGGSMLASLRTFENHWISKEEYAEVGASIVHRKCL
ncbi:hypothetical protein HYFRA_00012258 [Hymenoscyphus fraxineus]|uniref:Actin n=1 Tax=Hymenoscyphus fraxineus TaxID=746836 RepID=A0A9N9KZG6_9HELO|nr:hypothetical protein HYFRA_00012258 [Hymenoscyphus fraxineus]